MRKICLKVRHVSIVFLKWTLVLRYSRAKNVLFDLSLRNCRSSVILVKITKHRLLQDELAKMNLVKRALPISCNVQRPLYILSFIFIFRSPRIFLGYVPLFGTTVECRAQFRGVNDPRSVIMASLSTDFPPHIFIFCPAGSDSWTRVFSEVFWSPNFHTPRVMWLTKIILQVWSMRTSWFFGLSFD